MGICLNGNFNKRWWLLEIKSIGKIEYYKSLDINGAKTSLHHQMKGPEFNCFLSSIGEEIIYTPK